MPQHGLRKSEIVPSAALPPAPVQKGVGFSDRLIVLGEESSPPPRRIPPPPSYPYRPNPEMHSKNGRVSPASQMRACHTPSPLAPYGAPPYPYIPPSETTGRPSGKRRARFLLNDPLQAASADTVEEDAGATSCTDSEASATVSSAPPSSPATMPAMQGRHVPSDEHFAESTRINTKLNSMPSGGTFSFLNSSEDVDSDSSSTDDDELRLSRKMIRVDGSAKLSSASGLCDDDFFVGDDEFGIEDAEKVEEEEAVQVRSYGRSFAKVSLNNGEKDVIIRDPRRKGKSEGSSSVAWGKDKILAVEEATEKAEREDSAVFAANSQGEDAHGDFCASKSAPPRRKSKMRITFNRRSSNASSSKKCGASTRAVSAVSDDPTEFGGELDEESTLYDSDLDLRPVSCFGSGRKSTISSRDRSKSAASASRHMSSHSRVLRLASTAPEDREARKAGVKGKAGALVAMPDMSEAAVVGGERWKSQQKFVKNVSLQRDDWIDFATNAASRQKHSWLVRLVSSHGQDRPPRPVVGRNSTNYGAECSGEQREGRPVRRRSGLRFWRWWSRN